MTADSDAIDNGEPGPPANPLRAAYAFYAPLVSEAERQLAANEFSPTERRVLLELRREAGPTDRRLAMVLGKDRPQISNVLKSLMAKGLIESDASLSHKRQRQLRLSDQGNSAATELDRVWGEVLDRQYLGLSNGDRFKAVLSARAFHAPDTPRAPFPLIVRDFTSADAAWVLAHAENVRNERKRDSRFVGAMAADIAAALDAPKFAGATVTRGAEIVGTCLLIPLEDEAHSRLSGLFVSRDERAADIPGRLVARCVTKAQQLTYFGIEATAERRDTAVQSVLAAVGFSKGKGVITSLSYGPQESWLSYRKVLPMPDLRY